MALIAAQQAAITGTVVAYAAASAGGDTFRFTSNTELRIRNDSGASVDVTVVVPGNTEFAQPEPDITVAVPAGGEVAIGPLNRDLIDHSTGLIAVTYSATASVSVALVRV